MMIYDPVLGVEERTALEELGCVYIDNNEVWLILTHSHMHYVVRTQRCQRQVQVHTLFYMPHCGRAMYNNLLWANWSPQHLSKVAVIGNSFHSYLERLEKDKMSILLECNGVPLSQITTAAHERKCFIHPQSMYMSGVALVPGLPRYAI